MSSRRIVPAPGDALDTSLPGLPDLDPEEAKARMEKAIKDQWQSQAVSSTHLSGVEFNAALAKGRVTFDKGATYEYDGCTQEEFDAITQAASAGAAFRSYWGNGQKPYRRIQ